MYILYICTRWPPGLPGRNSVINFGSTDATLESEVFPKNPYMRHCRAKIKTTTLPLLPTRPSAGYERTAILSLSGVELTTIKLVNQRDQIKSNCPRLQHVSGPLDWQRSSCSSSSAEIGSSYWSYEVSDSFLALVVLLNRRLSSARFSSV